MKKTHKLIADTINGIMEDDDLQGYIEDGAILISEEAFIDSMKSTDDEDDYVAAEVSDETYEMLKEEYGIKKRN